MKAVTPLALVAAFGLSATTICGCDHLPRTDAARLARGRELVEKMSATLAAVPSFSVTTREVRTRRPQTGPEVRTSLTRETIVRRPDRLYFNTSGDVDNEGWYDGVSLTLVMHTSKVYGRTRLPGTVDGAVEDLTERHDMPPLLGDFLYSNPVRALLTAGSAGGWTGTRHAGTVALNEVLEFTDHRLSWTLRLPSSGPLLPTGFKVVVTGDTATETVEVEFADWNVAPSVPAEIFEPRVPDGYQNIGSIVAPGSVLKAQTP